LGISNYSYGNEKDNSMDYNSYVYYLV
jgi:hypothetical protein